MKRNKLMNECLDLVTPEIKLQVDAEMKAIDYIDKYTKIIKKHCQLSSNTVIKRAGIECALYNVDEKLDSGVWFNYNCYLKEPETVSIEDTEEFWLKVKEYIEYFKKS